MPQGSEVSPFTITQSIRHDFAYVRRRLFPAPSNFKHLGRPHSQKKTSTAHIISRSLLQLVYSTHAVDTIAGEKYRFGS